MRMNKQMIKILIINMLFGTCVEMYAQVHHSMSQLLDIESPATGNPASIESHEGLRVYLPEFYIGYGNTGPGFSALFTKGDANKYTFKRSEVLDAAQDNNTLEASGFVQTLGASYSHNRFTFFVSHGHKSMGYLRYPKEILELYRDGNAQFVGQQINIGPKILLQNYHQYSIGINTKVDKINVGIRIKYLSGVQDLSTAQSIFQLTTGNDFYELTLNNAYEIRSTDILTYTDFQNITFDYNSQFTKRPFGPNHGFGIDIGVSTSITDKLSISGGAYDLGQIHWQRSSRKYTSNSAKMYSGIDLLEIINNNNFELTDTIETLLQINEVEGRYKSVLPARAELVAKYKYNEKLNLLGAIHMGIIQNQASLSITGAANYSINKKYTIMTSLGFYHSQIWALGIGGKLRLNKITAFAYTNNIFGFIHTLDRSFANIHIGAYLSLASKK